MGNPNYKNKNIERKCLNNMRKNQYLKVGNSFIELEELFFKSIIVSIDDMDKLEQKEMKKIRPIKNTWCDWLSNCIPESIGKSADGFKDKIVSLFIKNTRKQTVYGKGKKPKTQNKINNIRNRFLLKKNKQEIKDKIIGDMRTLFETEEEKKKEGN